MGTNFGQGIEDSLLLPFLLVLIASAAVADIDHKPGILTSRPLRLLGEWSFALYLTHWLLVMVLGHDLPDVPHAPVCVRVLVDVAFVVSRR